MVMNWHQYAGALDDKGWGRDIPASGMVLWLKADSLDLEDGDPVTSWKSDAPGEYEFTQGTASAQPSFIASSSAVNNMPVIDCDGDDILSKSFEADLNTNEITVFVVAIIDSDDGNIHGIVESRGSSPVARSGFNIYGRMDGSRERWQLWGGANTFWVQVQTAQDSIVPGVADIITGKIYGGDGAGSTANYEIYENGVLAHSDTGAFYKSTADPYQLGNVPSSFYLNGKIAEVIQYNRNLTDLEQKQVESYLSEKYGISTASLGQSSNPYQDASHNPIRQKTNEKDNDIEFLFRPTQILDKSHAALFRHPPATDFGPQSGSNYYRATSGGKYGLFLSDAPNARTGTPSSPPYAPVYTFDPDASLTVPVSQGPKIPGVDVTGYDKKDITNPVARVVMSENTLEHFRADANRKSVDDDEGDYSVEPRYSQTLHPKGSKGDASYNTGDHSGE